MESLPTLISQARHITCIAHIRPDGDAVGSVAGLSLALKSLGKDVEPVLVDGVPSIFGFVAGGLDFGRAVSPDTDLCLILDCNDLHRTGQIQTIRQLAAQHKVAYVDHHPKGDLAGVASSWIHRPEASSTSEIVYDLILELGARVTPDIATSLMTGMFTDTGGFQYANTSTRTLEVAAELMRRGGRLQKIVQEVAHTKSMAGLRLLGISLERMRLTQGGRCAVSVLTHADMLATGAAEGDIAGIINNLNALPTTLFSVLLAETTPGIVRGILRSGDRHGFDVGRLAKAMGGGGHPRAAGFVIKGSIEVRGAAWRVIAPTEQTG